MSMKHRERTDHNHTDIRTQIITITDDITAELDAHIIDYSDPHHNFTALTANYLPKKSGTGLADSVIQESAAGNIGVGKIPAYKLDVDGNININRLYIAEDIRAGALMRMRSSNINVAYLQSTGWSYYDDKYMNLGNTGNVWRIAKLTAGVDRFRILSPAAGSTGITIAINGDVGINNLDPLAKLDVKGTSRFGDSTTNYLGIDGSGVVTLEGNSKFDGTVGIGTVAETYEHFIIQDLTVDTTTDYYGISNRHKKTAGITDNADDFYGIHNETGLNHNGGTIGYLTGFYNATTIYDGTATYNVEGIYNKIIGSGGTADNIIGSTNFLDLNTGTIADDIIGNKIDIDIEAGITSIGGDIYGQYIKIDADKDPTGSVYMLYLKELTNVDYGIYQDGTAANILKGQSRFGDAANYVQTSTGGVVTLEGTAKRNLTLRPEIRVMPLIAHSKPTSVTRGVHMGFSMPIWSSDNEELFLDSKVPDRWDESSDLTICMAAAISGAEDAGDKFNFQLSWDSITCGEVVLDTDVDVEVETTILAGRVDAWNVYKVEFTINYDEAGHVISKGDLLSWRLRRIAASANEVTNEIVVFISSDSYTVDKMFGAP